MQLIKVGFAAPIVAFGLLVTGGGIASAHHTTPDDNFQPVCTNPSNAGGHHNDKGDPGSSGGPGNGTGKDCSAAPGGPTPTPTPITPGGPTPTPSTPGGPVPGGPNSGVQGASTTVPSTGSVDPGALAGALLLTVAGAGSVAGGLVLRERGRRSDGES